MGHRVGLAVFVVTSSVGVALAAPPAAPTPGPGPAPAAASHTMLQPGDIKWGEGPPIMPAGLKMAVLYGDMSKPGLLVFRAKMPAGYKVPAHWHPVDENISVISGTFSMGMGDKLDASKTKDYPAGSFISMPASTNHFALTKGETIIEVTAMGPYQMTYVNPMDDPRTGAPRPSSMR